MNADRSTIGIDHLTVVPRAVPATEDGGGEHGEEKGVDGGSSREQ